jgi:hypothetical protein
LLAYLSIAAVQLSKHGEPQEKKSWSQNTAVLNRTLKSKRAAGDYTREVRG